MQALFERTVFRTESGGSEFDPHTCTMYLYRPSSDRPFESVAHHELMHWLQFIAYTLGGFQSALIHMRDECSKYILSQPVRFPLPEGEEQFLNSNFFHEGMDKNISVNQTIFRDSLICEKLFFRMSTCYGLSSTLVALKPELLIPRMLLRINNWAIDILCYKSTKPQGYLKYTDLGDHPKLINFGQATHDGIELDTQDIIEGMAVTSEICFLEIMEADASERMKEIANTSYVRAIIIFLKIMGFSANHDNVVRMVALFLAIAEMSLNPPLPPFGIIGKLELDWNKIYPPLRFIELCHIAKRVIGVTGYILDTKPSSWIFDWMAHVQPLYLAQGGTFSYLNKNIDGYLPNEKSVPFLALIAEENLIMREILRFKGVNTIGMAEKLPEVLKECTGLELYAMMRHGHILFMNYFGIPRPLLIPFKDENEKSALYMPPLVVFEDGDQVYGWSETFAQYLINLNLFHYPLHDIMLGQEPRLYLPDSPLIDEGKRKEIWDYLQKKFLHVF
jgi:hypothetical protein